jgi:hypothetical protein
MIGASLPDRIHIEVSSRKQPLAGLLILTRIVMEEQNDYFGIFGPTDDLGFLTITRHELLGAAAITRDFYAAEYADPLTAFAGLVEVRVLDEAGIERALEAHDELKAYPYAEGYYAMLTSARRVLQEMGRVLMEVLVTADGGTSEVKAEVPL